MNCSFIVGKKEEKECERPAKNFVTVTFIDDEGVERKERFGYCSRHWKLVRNYYKHEGVEVEEDGR